MNKKLYMVLTAAIASLSIFSSSAYAAAYTVQPGDYLWKIATANGITVQKLMEMNRLTSTSIYPGQILQIPDKGNIYITQYTDTLWKIAEKFGIDVKVLINANPQLTNPNNIWPGLPIQIPEKPDAFLKGRFPLPKGTYQPVTDNYSQARSWNPDGETVRTHEGVDILADKGTPIYSVLDGKIINIGWNQYGGWRLTIQVDDSTAFYYAHMSKYAEGMTMGAQVKQGQLIGYVGNTGYGPVGTEADFPPHLHLGVYQINRSPWVTINPYPYLLWWELQ